MAKDKTSFILYSDLIGVVKKLVLKDREECTNYAGELFLHILEYVNDNNPIPINFIVDMAFEPIKITLKRDLVKYETYISKQKENGSKGGRPKKETQKTQPFLKYPKKADSVSDSVTVSDNEILLKKEPKYNNYREFAHLKISFEEFEKLNQEYSKEQIDEVLDKIENYKKNTNYKSLFLTSKTWLKKEKGSAEKEKPMIGRMTQESVEKTFNAFLNVEANG